MAYHGLIKSTASNKKSEENHFAFFADGSNKNQKKPFRVFYYGSEHFRGFKTPKNPYNRVF